MKKLIIFCMLLGFVYNGAITCCSGGFFRVSHKMACYDERCLLCGGAALRKEKDKNQASKKVQEKECTKKGEKGKEAPKEQANTKTLLKYACVVHACKSLQNKKQGESAKRRKSVLDRYGCRDMDLLIP